VNEISTREFIQQKFAEYYKQNLSSIQPPTSLERREFAFLLFKEKTMMRHKGFKTADEFRGLLMNVVPSDVYYSSAYYEKPEVDMDAKGWIGADLIFDIDADHIPTPCNKQHDIWTCKNCGMSGRGAKPEKCPQCAGEKFNDVSWPCDVCLGSAKEETIKLIDVLDNDFGLSVEEMNLAFSGHRGYHVHVENEVVRTLDSMARKEIVDFLMGIGLESDLLGIVQGGGPKLEDFGWRGRIAKGTYEFLITASIDQLENAGLKKKSATQIINQREEIVESWKEKGPWKLLKGVGPESWSKIIEQAIEKQSVKIDTVVTTDIHRLIRLANTLHGETGLLKIELPANAIEGFDPFKSAVAFKHDMVTVDVSDAPQFRLEDNTYGPYKNQRVELPTAAAMMLLCKGVAKVVEEKTIVQ
jgi:DNA primase small subunit